MKYFVIFSFLTTILWQSPDVKGWNIQESIKMLLETLDDVEEYDIAFPLVIAPGMDTLAPRPKRHASISEFQRQCATEREEKGTGNPVFVDGGNEAREDNEGCGNFEGNVSRNLESGTRCKANSTRIKTSASNIQNTSINLQTVHFVEQRRVKSCNRRTNNELKIQKKSTLFDNKIKKKSHSTGPESNKEVDTTLIALKDWILEVRTNPILAVRDGFEAEWVSNGQKQSVLNPQVCKLQTGVVRDEVGSVVALTTCDSSPTHGGITGLVLVNGESYFVQPLVPTGGVNDEHPHLLYRAKRKLELLGDQDFGDDWKPSGSDSRQMTIMGLARSEPCGVGAVNSECPKRSKRESYWRHDMTELKHSNTTVRKESSSTEGRLDVFLVDEPEDGMEHNRAVIEHIRETLEREEEVGYFLDNDLETEGKRNILSGKYFNFFRY
jgi:hypothetical protein